MNFSKICLNWSIRCRWLFLVIVTNLLLFVLGKKKKSEFSPLSLHILKFLLIYTTTTLTGTLAFMFWNNVHRYKYLHKIERLSGLLSRIRPHELTCDFMRKSYTRAVRIGRVMTVFGGIAPRLQLSHCESAARRPSAHSSSKSSDVKSSAQPEVFKPGTQHEATLNLHNAVY